MKEYWKDKIVEMVCVKQELMKLDADGIWPHHFPEIAANEKDIRRTEAYLCHRIDNDYREFLKMANGWKGFCQTVDLFGTQELTGSSFMDYALSILEVIEDDVIKSTGFKRENLLPIAASRLDRDLYVIARPISHSPGTIIWFAGEEIERYPSFTEYFLAMIDYNRLMVEDIRKEARE